MALEDKEHGMAATQSGLNPRRGAAMPRDAVIHGQTASAGAGS